MPMVTITPCQQPSPLLTGFTLGETCNNTNRGTEEDISEVSQYWSGRLIKRRGMCCLEVKWNSLLKGYASTPINTNRHKFLIGPRTCMRKLLKCCSWVEVEGWRRTERSLTPEEYITSADWLDQRKPSANTLSVSLLGTAAVVSWGRLWPQL